MGRWGRKRRRGRRQVLAREEVNIVREAELAVQRAVRRETRIVTIGPLIFFSTESGDAWVLDPGDGLARRLANDGTSLPHGIHETAESFGVEWQYEYEFDGDAMIVRGDAGTRVITGYPVAAIQRAIHGADGAS